ncbi:FAD-linked oxidase-like protein [Paraphaeosphaeria sporulosa]|uniref:FAD-linked oxidase-like protein n=1 Tax=Paraphaeosphaeria sporulosa TaxID=1460663 RepID=A0A177CM43_9PLEO|nr:FAD-linked oxidase-like protein [Paraphaeosphaeria sporulosa]OAG08605.1 FAD-linked oxidase-like protein [Paraphaeosphaeria sporulosa]
MAPLSLPVTPTLRDAHSGIPERLLHKATHAKLLIYDGKTVSDTIPLQRGLPIPQGISKKAFLSAIDEIRDLLGAEHVQLNDKEIKNGWYMESPNTHDMMPLFDFEEFIASAVVYPGSVEDVKLIVKWANKHLVPLFPLSIGRNLGYGGSAPRVRGSVTIDLGRRMNRILDINADDFTCLVEPGVTFYALHEELVKRGLDDKMWIDTPDLGGGSVIGNTLDRGVGYTPYGDHWACHSGLEVVLPGFGEDGDVRVIRTGMGALGVGGEKTWQCFPYGFGPYNDGIFSQSNLGIVTKMGMTLMPNPGGFESFMYTFPNESDLAPLIEIIRPLRISNILENVAQLRHGLQTLSVKGHPRTKYFDGTGPMPEDIVRNHLRQTATGECAWVYYGMSYGPAHIRRYKLEIIDKEFHRIPGCKRVDPSTLPADEYFWSRDRIASGTPDLEELKWVNWMPNGSHIAFSPVSPIRGKDAENLFELARKRHSEAGIDLMPAFCVGLREMHLIVEIVFDAEDAGMKRRAEKCLRDMIDDAAKLGYGEYRTHLALMDQVAGTYNWNDNALMKFNNTLKDALDPNGILAPGRCGIWPRRYRNRGWELKGGETNTEGDGVAPVSGNLKM